MMVTPMIRSTTVSGRVGRTLWHAQNENWWTPRGMAPVAISGAALLSAGVFGAGRRIEGDGSNLVTNPSFEVSTTGWVVNNLTITRHTGAAAFGEYGARLQATAINAGHYATFGSMPVTAGDPVTVSIHARKGTGPDWVRFGEVNDSVAHLAWFNLATGAAGSTSGSVSSATIEDLGGGLFRIAVSAIRSTTGNAALFYSIETSDGGTSFDSNGTEYHLIDGAQCEVHPCATAYTDGARGSGFAWSGSPNASTSVRSASVVAGQPRAISPVTGSTAAWLRPSWSGTAEDSHILWHWLVGGGEELTFGHAAGEWRFEAAGRGSVASIAIPAAQTAGVTVFVWATWSADRLVVGTGTGHATSERSGAIASGPGVLRVGGRADSTGGALDGVLDTLLYFDRARAASEMQRLGSRTIRVQPNGNP